MSSDLHIALSLVGDRYGPGTALTPVGAGAWSRAFRFDVGGRALVIRAGDYREDFETDALAARWNTPELPTPEVLEVGEAAAGVYYAISRFCHGEPLEQLSPEGFEATLPSLLAALDAIRSIDISDTTGFGGWDHTRQGAFETWRDFMLAVDYDGPDLRTAGWSARLRDTEYQTVFDAGYEVLATLATDLEPGRYVVHGDLLERNVHVDGGRITGVFDWGCSLYGDFLYDVAWLEFWSPWHDGLATFSIRDRVFDHLASEGIDTPGGDVRMRAAAVHVGLSHLAYYAGINQPGELASVAERTSSYL